jgi:hypothetical protein
VEQWRALARERARAFARVVAIFHEEGAPQLAGTDALNPYNVQGDSLHQELDNFVAAGMRPFEALRCATSDAARFLGQGSRWGTLEVGKRADVVLLGADPLRDIGAVRRVAAVCVNGYYLERADLDSLLEQRLRLINNPPPIPSTTLPAAAEPGETVAEGSWIERIVEAEFGRFTYRHRRLPDRGWRIEECHAGADPRRHLDRRTVRLALAADLTVRSAEYEVESFVGTEAAHLTWSESSGYVLDYRAVDGYESRTSLPGTARVPSEQLALSAIPRLIAERGAGSYAALDVTADQPGRAELTIAPADDAEAWRVQVNRPGQQVDQTYRVGPDGTLAEMREMLPLLWPREVAPAERVVDAHA